MPESSQTRDPWRIDDETPHGRRNESEDDDAVLAHLGALDGDPAPATRTYDFGIEKVIRTCA